MGSTSVSLRAPSDPAEVSLSINVLMHVPPSPSTLISRSEVSHVCWHRGRRLAFGWAAMSSRMNSISASLTSRPRYRSPFMRQKLRGSLDRTQPLFHHSFSPSRWHPHRPPLRRSFRCRGISSRQQNPELVRFQALMLSSLWPVTETSLRQSLLEQPKPLAIVDEQFHRCPASIAEHEHRPAIRIPG